MPKTLIWSGTSRFLESDNTDLALSLVTMVDTETTLLKLHFNVNHFHLGNLRFCQCSAPFA